MALVSPGSHFYVQGTGICGGGKSCIAAQSARLSGKRRPGKSKVPPGKSALRGKLRRAGIRPAVFEFAV